MSSSNDDERLIDDHIRGNTPEIQQALTAFARMPPSGRTLPSLFAAAVEAAASASLDNEDNNGKKLIYILLFVLTKVFILVINDCLYEM